MLGTELDLATAPDAVFDAIQANEPLCRSARGDRIELTVRAYPCPVTSRRRYLLVLDSDEVAVWDFAVKREALAAYRALVTKCEADYARDGSHAWTATDAPRIPVLT